jgi:hypothetical protein
MPKKTVSLILLMNDDEIASATTLTVMTFLQRLDLPTSIVEIICRRLNSQDDAHYVLAENGSSSFQPWNVDHVPKSIQCLIQTAISDSKGDFIMIMGTNVVPGTGLFECFKRLNDDDETDAWQRPWWCSAREVAPMHLTLLLQDPIMFLDSTAMFLSHRSFETSKNGKGTPGFIGAPKEAWQSLLNDVNNAASHFATLDWYTIAQKLASRCPNTLWWNPASDCFHINHNDASYQDIVIANELDNELRNSIPTTELLQQVTLAGPEPKPIKQYTDEYFTLDANKHETCPENPNEQKDMHVKKKERKLNRSDSKLRTWMKRVFSNRQKDT